MTTSLTVAFVIALASGAMSPVTLITPGRDGPAAGQIAVDFGPGAVTKGTGYDGQQTYVVARHFPDFDAMSPHLDVPRYRILRILPPALASPLPAGAPTVLGLLATNLLGTGVAVWGAERMLPQRRRHLAALAAVPLLFGLVASTTEPLAWGLAIVALSLRDEARHRSAAAMLCLAVLSRETAVVVAAACAIVTLLESAGKRHRASAALPYAIPPLVGLGWYVTAGTLAPGAIVDRFGLFEVLQLPWRLLVFVTVLFMAGIAGALGWRGRPAAQLVCVGFSVWMLGYKANALDVWAIMRVNGLAISLGLIGLAVWTTDLWRGRDNLDGSLASRLARSGR